MLIDPTAWGEPDPDMPQSAGVDTLIGILFLSAVTLLIGAVGFWLGRVTA